MKKLTAIFLCALLTLSLLSGCGRTEAGGEPSPADPEPAAETAGPAETDAPEEDQEPVAENDYEAMMEEAYARLSSAWHSHDPAEPVCRINGQAVTWGSFFYFLNDYLESMLYYTAALPEDFNAELTEGQTIGEYFLNYTLSHNKYIACAREKMDELGIALTGEDEAEIGQVWDTLVESYGSEEAVLQQMDEVNLDRETFLGVIRSNMELAAVMGELYGLDGEKMTAEQVVSWAEENGYVRAEHIFYYCFSDETGLPLEGEEKAEKLSQAEAALSELSALSADPEALAARFAELMSVRSEDLGGLMSFPEGYTFTNEAAMYPEFKEAAFALEEYGLSDVVESSAGYHILLRLPLTPEGLTMEQDSNTGDYLSLRQCAANELFNRELLSWIGDAEVEWESGFENLDLNALFAVKDTGE